MTEKQDETGKVDETTRSVDVHGSGEWYTAPRTPVGNESNNDYFAMEPKRSQEETMRGNRMDITPSDSYRRNTDLLPRPWEPTHAMNGGGYRPPHQPMHSQQIVQVTA